MILCTEFVDVLKLSVTSGHHSSRVASRSFNSFFFCSTHHSDFFLICLSRSKIGKLDIIFLLGMYWCLKSNNRRCIKLVENPHIPDSSLNVLGTFSPNLLLDIKISLILQTTKSVTINKVPSFSSNTYLWHVFIFLHKKLQVKSLTTVNNF